MLAPALDAISGDLHIGPDEANMAVSVFVLAFAFGLMALAPMTELSGRWNVWILPSMWYVVWNTACGFAHGKGLMLVGGVLAGLGASTEVAVCFACFDMTVFFYISSNLSVPVTNPVRGDCWCPERGHSFAISTASSPSTLSSFPEKHTSSSCFTGKRCFSENNPVSYHTQWDMARLHLSGEIVPGAVEVYSDLSDICSPEMLEFASTTFLLPFLLLAFLAAFLALATASFKAAPGDGRFSRDTTIL
ncbi:hypothetical protein MPDQ_001440 [Monascus purpureus]|uniref:Uncharacterized protein n=1 Tax=Monascus purpureus TaxID=5098 RepID=A0A507R2N2_MONPU|nr:hypothetical protein MPDQ_001440 [Monascus purpureus]BDD61651.1 hypothetical protein MAP00_006689 [Monascus purpureus]